MLRELVEIFYERHDLELRRGRFRVRGDTLEVMPAYAEFAYRVEFFGDEVERITEIDPLTGELVARLDEIEIFPAKHFITPQDKLTEAIGIMEEELESQLKLFRDQGKLLEAQRLEQRTRYDMEMLREVGYCSGIENYSRVLALRPPGSRPFTLLDYFPPDWLLIVDESHMTLPQVHGMFNGDRGAQNRAGRLRLPPAVRAGQPAAPVRGVGGFAEPGDLHQRHAGRLRAEPLIPGRRADHPAHRLWSTPRWRSGRPRGRWTTC